MYLLKFCCSKIVAKLKLSVAGKERRGKEIKERIERNGSSIWWIHRQVVLNSKA